jgi:hypothetical protein
MIDERILKAKRAELKGFVEANATDDEMAHYLMFTAFAESSLRFGQYEPTALMKQLAARIKLRVALLLPKRDCIVSNPPPDAASCACLSEVLDRVAETGEEVTRLEIVRAARMAHNKRWDWLKRLSPRPPSPRPEPPPGPENREPKHAQSTEARREPVSSTSTSEFRVVKRTRKWFDSAPGIQALKF